MRPSLQHPHRTQGEEPDAKDMQLEQRRRQVAGLAILGIVILAFSVWRAGLGAVFPSGWWRLW